MIGKTKGHPETGEIVAFLGKGTDFKGTLHFEGTIRIDGRLEGEIVTKDTLIVGESAEIMGDIRVGTIITSGRITGNIHASKLAHLLAPGSLNGDVKTESLKVDEGFAFNGRCEMTKGTSASGALRPEQKPEQKKEALSA
ncbi:MAG: polymer-forming cytoskeletal protein [Nitrospirota bacterium]